MQTITFKPLARKRFRILVNGKPGKLVKQGQVERMRRMLENSGRKPQEQKKIQLMPRPKPDPDVVLSVAVHFAHNAKCPGCRRHNTRGYFGLVECLYCSRKYRVVRS